MNRLRFVDLRTSRLPNLIGLCDSDYTGVARYVNTAQEKLLFARESGDEGWYGTWAEVVFNVSRETPYVTLPRDIARLQSINVCQRYAPVQNQFYEYLTFGNGRMPKTCGDCGDSLQSYSRNNAILWHDIGTTPQLLRFYITNGGDVDKRILVQGTSSGSEVYSVVDGVRISGTYVTLASPFVTTGFSFDFLTGLQKDVTLGEVQVFKVDPTTGEEVLALIMGATETTAWYRRYYFDSLPRYCCTSSTTLSQTLQVSAIAKMDLVPVAADPDYLLLQNKEALIEEAHSIYLSEVENTSAKQMAAERHRQAIWLLNGELNHYLGAQQAAVNFMPFGSATLERYKIGTMV